MRPIVAAAAGILLFAAPGIARAGTVTLTQYAYGGGSNATAVIAIQQPTSQSGGQSRAGEASSAGRGGVGRRSNGSSTTKPRHPAEPPLVGVAASASTPVSAFAALNRSIPVDVLWAITLAIACALGAWLLQRGKGAG